MGMTFSISIASALVDRIPEDDKYDVRNNINVVSCGKYLENSVIITVKT